MRIEEARWIGDSLARLLPPPAGGDAPVALNLGSGTRKSREQSKRYIQQLTITPLAHAGYRVVHSDLMQGDGIDLSGNIFDEPFQRELAALHPRLVYFCNVMEHLDPALRGRVPTVLDAILAPGGLLVLTVPLSYPYHADPLDTMYRPRASELTALFPGYEVLRADEIDCDSYRTEFLGAGWGKRIRKLLRLLFPFVRPRRWLSHAHRFFWLFKPYRQSCVVLKKPA